MRTYRYPTSILWASIDGYKHINAATIDHAMRQVPKHITLAHLQVQLADGWHFV